jgi:threonine dehydrogenase-like Zn-dependent dehydrogenase
MAAVGDIARCAAKARACAPVIVIGSNAERLKTAKNMGADYTINIKEISDPVAEVKRLTGGVGVDFVIESVGTAETYEQAFKMLRRGGKVEAFGITAQGQTASLEPYEFVLGEKKVSGSCAGIGNNWGEAITLLHYGIIDPKPMFSMAVPLFELETALNEIRENKSLVKVFRLPGTQRTRLF